MRRAALTALAGLTVLGLSGCLTLEEPTPVATPTAVATPTESAAPTPNPTTTEAPSPTATPRPTLALDLPEGSDPRVVSATIEPSVGAEGGEIIIRVTSAADSRIDELVLRWPTELGETLFLAPFVPSEERIRDGGPPLVQEWTKWVIGPGERGEPSGTVSLGYGPLLAGATLSIPLHVRRVSDGAVRFELQLLAGNEILALEDGDPAEYRVEIP